MTPPDDIRDFRYCEILPVFRRRAMFTVEIYNTVGLNDCSPDLWNKLDRAALAEAYGAVTVIMNGPRHWVINRQSAVAQPRPVFAGVKNECPNVQMEWVTNASHFGNLDQPGQVADAINRSLQVASQ